MVRTTDFNDEEPRMDTLATTDSSPTRRSNSAGHPAVHPCTRDFMFSLVTCGSLVVMGSWSLTAIGCSAGAKTNEQRTAQRRSDGSNTTIADKNAAKNAALGKGQLSVRGPDSATTDGATTEADSTVIQNLAATVDNDRAALATMSNQRKYTGTSSQKFAKNASTSANVLAADTTQADAAAGTLPATWNGFRMASVEPKIKTYLPNGKPTMMDWQPNPVMAAAPATFGNPPWNSTQNNGNANAIATARSTNNTNFNTNTAANPGANTGANTGVQVAQEIPTDPMQLSKLLANAFANAGASSLDPMRVWFIYSSLAVSNPDIDLPEGFGSDLLQDERDRIVAAHAGFAALGRSFRDGATKVDAPTRQALVAALTGEPSLTIPHMDLCTKVVGFGDYAPMAHRRFLAGATSRVIVYSELDGFKSHLENGKWTTRLSTRVSIVPADSSKGNMVAWSRTPEWTDVVDAADAPRCEFFLGEIIPITSSLAVGNYRVKVEVKDLATGVMTETFLPIELLDERAFAAVAD